MNEKFVHDCELAQFYLCIKLFYGSTSDNKTDNTVAGWYELKKVFSCELALLF